MQTRQKEINTKDIIFYSQKAIGIATFIGGPLAAGYLIRENYKVLDQTEKGNNALIISIIATIALFVLIFSIPENIIEKVPKVIIPAIYTGAIVFWVEQTFGAIFKQHEEHKYNFFSRWRAAGIGFISLLKTYSKTSNKSLFSASTNFLKAFSLSESKPAFSSFSSNSFLVLGLLHNSLNSASLLNKFGISPNKLFRNSSDVIGFPLASQNIVCVVC